MLHLTAGCLALLAAFALSPPPLLAQERPGAPSPVPGPSASAAPSIGTSYCDEAVDRLLFESDFESGDLAAEGWTVNGTVDAGAGAYGSSLSARLFPSSSIVTYVDTTGASRVRLDYARRTQILLAPHWLWIEWWDGTTWQQVERVREGLWHNRSVELPAGAADNPSFGVRFRHSGPLTHGRAYIDNVRVRQRAGKLQVAGSPSVADNDLRLVATDLPTPSVGVFLFGTSQAQIPMGNGFLCVGGTRQRLNPPFPGGPVGSATRVVDLTAEPALSAIALAAPITIYFQLLHRQRPTTNLSNAVMVQFTP